ncbi:glycosyltransferase [bacterium]|nr:glycosyltransferase [bacterium]
MKQVLMLAPYFPPRRRVGSLRPFKFAVHLREFGWKPTIVTFGTDQNLLTEKERHALEGIEVLSLKPPMDRTQTSESHLNKNAPPKANLTSFVDQWFPIDTWLPFWWSQHFQLLKIVHKIKPHVLWSTADPWSSHVAALSMSKQFKIPWIADFRDPWTLCPVRNHHRWNISRNIDRLYEKQILKRASRIVFTARQTEERYRTSYPVYSEKMKTIYNSFESEAVEKNGDENALTVKDQLNVVFFGKFRTLSSAKNIIEVIAECKTIDPELGSFIRIFSFGNLNHNDRCYAEKRGVLNQFNVLDPVLPEMAYETLKRFDVLLLSTSDQRNDIIPAKLWDYLPAGKPILSLSQNNEIENILRTTNTGIQFSDNSVYRSAKFLLYCVQAKRDGLELPYSGNAVQKTITTFSSTSTSQKLADLLNEALHG